MTTPPEKRCTRPHGMPCLAHKDVMLGELAPCDNCAPHRDRVRQLILSSPAIIRPKSITPPLLTLNP